MKKKIFTLITACACIAGVYAQETSTQSIIASDDVYIYGDVGDKNTSRGSEEILRSYYNDGATSREMVFLKFDLTSLSEIEQAKILSVKLNMYGTADAGGGNSTPTTHNLCVFNMTATNPTFAWTEASLGYNAWFGNGVNSSVVGEGNSGQSDAYFFRRNPNVTSSNNNGNPDYLIAKLENIAAGTAWYEWDITTAIKAALTAGYTNISLQVCDELNVRLPGGSTRSYVTFHSKENASTNAPKLDVLLDFPSGIESADNNGVNYSLDGNTLRLTNVEGNTAVSIVNLSGKEVHKITINTDYSYSFAQSGVYLVSVSNNLGIATHKVVIR